MHPCFFHYIVPHLITRYSAILLFLMRLTSADRSFHGPTLTLDELNLAHIGVCVVIGPTLIIPPDIDSLFSGSSIEVAHMALYIIYGMTNGVANIQTLC